MIDVSTYLLYGFRLNLDCVKSTDQAQFILDKNPPDKSKPFLVSYCMATLEWVSDPSSSSGDYSNFCPESLSDLFSERQYNVVRGLEDDECYAGYLLDQELTPEKLQAQLSKAAGFVSRLGARLRELDLISKAKPKVFAITAEG